MKYFIIKACFIDYPSKLNRVFLIRSDADMLDVVALILHSLRVDAPLNFRIKGKENEYYHGKFDFLKNGVDIQNSKICDFEKRFILRYNNFQIYNFRCTISKSILLPNTNDLFLLQESLGKGIFENNKKTLLAVLKNDIDLSLTKEGLMKLNSCFSMPTNLNLKTLGEFNEQINIEKEQKYLVEEMKKFKECFKKASISL